MATWTFDPAHTSASFSARHMMVSTVRGSFAPPTGTLEFDENNPAAAKVYAELDASTLTSGVADRDNHLRSPDFIDAGNFPTITFSSTNVEVTGDNTANVTGDLTIRGVTHPVVLKTEFLGIVNSPFGDKRAGFSATGKFNREDWGLNWNMAIEAGGVLVGKEIKIELDLEAILVPETEGAAATNA